MIEILLTIYYKGNEPFEVIEIEEGDKDQFDAMYDNFNSYAKLLEKLFSAELFERKKMTELELSIQIQDGNEWDIYDEISLKYN